MTAPLVGAILMLGRAVLMVRGVVARTPILLASISPKSLPSLVPVAALCLALCSDATAQLGAGVSDTLSISQRQPNNTFKEIFGPSLGTGISPEGMNDTDQPVTINSGIFNQIPISGVSGTGFTLPADFTPLVRTAKLVEGAGSTRISDLVTLAAAKEPLAPTNFSFSVTLMSDSANSLGTVDLLDPLRVVEDAAGVNITNQLFYGTATLPNDAPNPPSIRIVASSDAEPGPGMIPEPASLVILGTGMLGVVGCAWLYHKRAAA